MSEEYDTSDFVTVDELLKADDAKPEVIILPAREGQTKPRKCLIQPLSREEVQTGRTLKNLGEITGGELECIWISAALLAPKMTEAQVKAWQQKRGSGGDFTILSQAISRMSGLDEGTPKSVVQNANGKSRSRK